MGKSFVKYALLTMIVISLLLITAHFVRMNQAWFAATFLVLIVISQVFREPLIVKITQAGLIIAACEWLRTTFVLVALRMQEGGAWIRLTVILVGVAGFTFGSVFAFRSKSLKELYGLTRESKPENE